MPAQRLAIGVGAVTIGGMAGSLAIEDSVYALVHGSATTVEAASAPDSRQVHVCHLSGTLDGETFVQFEAHLDRLLGRGASRFAFELSGLSFMSSAGVGIIVNCLHRAAKRNGCVVLVRPRDMVREVFQILGLANVLPITDNLDDAITIAAA